MTHIDINLLIEEGRFYDKDILVLLHLLVKTMETDYYRPTAATLGSIIGIKPPGILFGNASAQFQRDTAEADTSVAAAATTEAAAAACTSNYCLELLQSYKL